MKPAIVALILIIWIVLYISLYFIGSFVIDSIRDTYVKRGYKVKAQYDEQKKNYRFYLTTFFLIIPVLVVIGWEI